VTAVRQQWASWGFKAVSGGSRKKLAKTRHDFRPVSLRYAPPGPPTSWVPPVLPASQIPPARGVETAHIPLERGGARVVGWPQSGQAEAMGGEDGGSGG